MKRIREWLFERRIIREDRGQCAYGLSYLREHHWKSDLICDTRAYDRNRRSYTMAGGR